MRYIILDLEATCDDKKIDPRFDMEIIEIGALMFQSSEEKYLKYPMAFRELKKYQTLHNLIKHHDLNYELYLTGVFQSFIKPIKNSKLTRFCKDLTSISQYDVDNALDFIEVIDMFQKWIGDDDYVLGSWGYYDKKQLQKDCNLWNVSTSWLHNHYSIKHEYAKLKKIRPCGIAKALTKEKFNFDGIPHRALNDTINISKIFIEYYNYFKNIMK